jgi:hypothetical protein
MSAAEKDICVDVLSLPRKSRAEIAHRLLVSLEDDLPSAEVEAEWKAAAQKRLANIRAGRATWRDAKTAIRSARKKLARR